jgi:HlyD family secretion protein
VATGKDRAVGRQLRTLFNVGTIRDLTDGQLLERFATGRGEGAELAFAALVERHGPMVLRVARGVLDDPHDAEDAFQATFLVLVSKARGLWVRDSLGPWLHQVAYRTSTCLRSGVARRRKLERRAALTEEAPQARPIDDRARVLLEEVDRLPERYRAPVVLCDLEGRTHEQAARALGWPVGTVKSRQARARDRLRDRLRRRGVAPGLAPLATWPTVETLLPATLVDQTTVAAVRFVTSRAIAPGTAAALAREVIRSMIILRWTKAVTILMALGAAGSGVGLIAQDQGKKPVEKAQAAPVADPSVIEVKPGKLRLMVSERGVLEPSRVRDVLCEVEGGTTIIMIKPEGTPVKEGEVVAELDSANLRDTLINQRITTQQAVVSYNRTKQARESAESAVAEYTQGILPSERATLKGKIALAQSDIERSRDRIEQARRDRKRLDEALRRRVGPETPSDIVADLTLNDRLEAAKLDAQKSEFDLEQAKTEQDLLERYTIAKRTKSLQFDIERARSDELGQQSRWELEKSKERKAERQIERCTLKAPGDGIVVYASAPGRNVPQIEEGASVRERQKIFSIPDMTVPMRVNVFVHEPLVDRLKPGQSARIKVEAAPDEVLTGVVRSVAPRIDPNIYLANGRKIYPTFVEFDKSRLNLRPGMSAAVEIVFEEAENVLQVPISCVFVSEKGEQDFVAVKSPGGAVEWREVTLGRADQRVIEIKAGLKPGDLVVREPKAGMGLDMTGKRRP